jgi:hypothetical protein
VAVEQLSERRLVTLVLVGVRCLCPRCAAGLILWDDQGPDQGRSAVRYSKWTRDEAVEGDRGITTTRQEHTMVATTITAPWAPAVFTTIGAGIVTAARFVGHFLLALLGVIFLGTGTDH